MYKIIIILILLIIMWYMIRRTIRDWGQSSQEKMTPGKDVMIQDPVCKVYVTTGSAITEEVSGETYYFCSQDCARHFKRDRTT